MEMASGYATVQSAAWSRRARTNAAMRILSATTLDRDGATSIAAYSIARSAMLDRDGATSIARSATLSIRNLDRDADRSAMRILPATSLLSSIAMGRAVPTLLSSCLCTKPVNSPTWPPQEQPRRRGAFWWPSHPRSNFSSPRQRYFFTPSGVS